MSKWYENKDWHWKQDASDKNTSLKASPGLARELSKRYIPAHLQQMHIRELSAAGIKYKEKGWRKKALKRFGLEIDQSTDYHSKNHKKSNKDGFYKSWEWKKLRFEVIKIYGPVCMCCGSDHRIIVDHIKPRSKFPDLALDFDNMQVLCNDCNMGKSNDDYTDFRPKNDELTTVEYMELERMSDEHLH